MTILITGAAGFIGSFLSRALTGQGHDVIGIDNFHPYYDRRAKEFNLDLTRLQSEEPLLSFQKSDLIRIFSKLEEFSSFPAGNEVGTFTFLEADIRDSEKIGKIFSKKSIDTVVHLAAMAGVPYSIQDPLLYSDVNINGTVNLLNHAAANHVSNFVFASSSSVYGATAEVPFKETQNVDNPISPYAATKRMGEIMCYTFNYLHKLPITCLRFFTVYGPLQRPYGMAIQKFIKLVDQGKPMTIYGDGKMARDFTYIDDTLQGIIAAIKKPQAYAIYNLGNTNPVTVNKLAETIIKYLGKGKKTHLEKPATEVPITYADISSAEKDFGYSPEINIQEGLRRQIGIYKIMPAWYKQLDV